MPLSACVCSPQLHSSQKVSALQGTQLEGVQVAAVSPPAGCRLLSLMPLPQPAWARPLHTDSAADSLDWTRLLHLTPSAHP